MMFKEDYERAWNAALQHAAEHLDGYDVGQFEKLVAPSSTFDEWYVREVVDPPSSIHDWSAEDRSG